MSLNIGVGDGKSLVPLPGEPSLSLDNDGYYWFLLSLFERLCAETGQMIDLYGDASFAGASLTALERIVAEARTMVLAKPEFWSVHVGTQVQPVRREVYEPVDREAFLALLDRWTHVIVRAEELGRPVVCFGD